MSDTVCPACDGTGDGTDSDTCAACDGAGTVTAEAAAYVWAPY